MLQSTLVSKLLNILTLTRKEKSFKKQTFLNQNGFALRCCTTVAQKDPGRLALTAARLREEENRHAAEHEVVTGRDEEEEETEED